MVIWGVALRRGLFEALRTIGDLYMGAENALVEALEKEGEIWQI